MVNLMSLSDEVLRRIAFATVPHGIQALSQCSRRLLILCKAPLIQHHKYKMSHRDIQINMGVGPGPLLVEVIRNPRLVEYIRHADFEVCTNDTRIPLSEDISKPLTDTLIQRPCMSLIELPHWVQQAALGHQGIIVAMLLLLLPELETLVIPSTRHCESIIQAAVQRFRGSAFRHLKLPLASLKEVTIGDDIWDRARPGRFFVDHAMKIVQGLPQLRILSCYFRTNRALDNSNIVLQLFNGSTSLHIFDLELSAEDFDIILQHINNLTEFTYIDRYTSSQTRNLGETLRIHAGDSLEEVLLHCVPTPNLATPIHGFKTLIGFTELKNITIPLDTIHTIWNRSSPRPTFSEFLPESVEALTIFGPKTMELASRVLDELAGAKTAHFPKLARVLMSTTENPSGVQVAGEKEGIVLELDDDEDDGEDDDEEGI